MFSYWWLACNSLRCCMELFTLRVCRVGVYIYFILIIAPKFSVDIVLSIKLSFVTPIINLQFKGCLIFWAQSGFYTSKCFELAQILATMSGSCFQVLCRSEIENQSSLWRVLRNTHSSHVCQNCPWQILSIDVSTKTLLPLRQ